MLDTILTLHSYFRWFVLAFAIAAIVLAVLSASGSRPWDMLTDRASLLYTVVLDIQFLIGLLLWVVEQRWQIADVITWAHPLAMVAAIALAHIGRSRSDAAPTDRARGAQTALFFGASVLVILFSIPWSSWPV
jgi:hypothetical protein